MGAENYRKIWLLCKWGLYCVKGFDVKKYLTFKIGEESDRNERIRWERSKFVT